MDWKAAIGNLFHLNEERLAHPVDSEEFGEKDLILRKAIAAFKTKYKTELQQPKLHFECKAVLTSLKNHWDGLTVFLDHPYIPMDNNESERKMRNPGLGRKNYYGSGRIWSAHFTAKMFSIFQTLIKWNINVLDWLKSYLEACAQNKGIPPDDITTFLPWNISDE
jgi:transposase